MVNGAVGAYNAAAMIPTNLSQLIDLVLAFQSKLVVRIFGHVQWQAPAWIPWLGRQARRCLHFFVADRRRQAITAAVLLAGVGGLIWNHVRPRPRYLLYEVKPPALTQFNENGVPTIHPLVVDFEAAAAPLANLDKRLTSGIRISPDLAGAWTWVNDKRLQFAPSSDWPIDTTFTVKISRKGFLAKSVLLEDYSFDFKTQPFSAKITDSKFYQDPQNPTEKSLVATVSFSHPVDVGGFERHVSLVPAKDAEFLGLTPDSKQFTVVYDKLRLFAYIHSAALAMPRDDTSITLKIGEGVRAARGGNATSDELEAVVAIPGRASLRFSDAQMTLVDNERYEPEQVLLVTSSSPVPEHAFVGRVSAHLLPVRHPDQPKEDKQPYNWTDNSEIGNDILAKSESLPLAYVASDEGSQTTHGFKFLAPVGRYVFLWIKEGVEGTGGYVAGKPYTATIKVQPYRQALTFLGKGALLPLAGDKKVGFLVRDVGRVQVEVGRVLPNQLQHLAPQMWDYTKPELGGLEDSIVERFTTVRDYRGQKPGKPAYDSIDLGQYLEDKGARRGLFLLHLRPEPGSRRQPEYESDENESESNNYQAVEDTRLILVTDLGFIVKQSNDGSRDVFVQSLHRGEPVGGARVEVLGRNGEPVAAATTDATGRAQLAKLPVLRREKTPLMILVEKDADFSFMPLRISERNLDLSRFEIGGVVNATSPQQLSAYLFTDRGIYRPSESTHIGIITRTADWKSSLSGLSIELEISDPRANVVKRDKITLSPNAFDEVTFSTQAASPTGTYQATAWLPKDDKRRELLGSVSFNVQEFEPDRMKVRLDLSAKSLPGWLTPAEVQARVSVMHLFGEPAGNRRIEGELNLSPVLPHYDKYPDYRFQIGEVVKEPFHQALAATMTDEKGNAELNLELQRFAGRAYRLNVLARAFEAEGGRSVAAQNTAIVADAPYLVGVKTDGDMTFIHRSAARQARWLAVNQLLNPVAANQLTLEWVERKYLSVLTQQPDRTYKYASRLKETVRNTRSVQIAAGGSNFAIPTEQPGDFILILRNAAGAELNRLNYSVVGEANVSRSLDRNAELQIQLDKPSYSPGETISVSIRAPYAGAGLITIERDRVYHHQWFRTATTSSVQRVTLPPGFEGNGYVTVEFLRDPASDEIFMSPLSYGVAPFAANLATRTLDVDVAAPHQVKPGAVLTMHVAPAEASRVAVFAVDEGILQVARYKNPDPLGYFFQKRMLQVETSQILDLMLPEFRRFLALAAPGGDADGGFARHLNPFNRKRKPAVAWWSGIIDVGPDGRDLHYIVPDYFNGRLRIVAVAVNAHRAGVTQEDTEVKGDFILTPNVPAMVAPGDEFSVTVGVFNNSPGKGSIRVQAQVSRELALTGVPTTELEVAEKREGVAEFRLKANAVLGPATLTFTAVRGRAAARMEESISVRPPVAYRTQLTLGRFEGSSTTVNLKRDLYPEQRTVEASVSALPLVWGQALIAYLDEYPHPCTEQLVSKGFAALLLASRPEFGKVRTHDVQPIASTLSMLQSRENDSGGFGLWTSSPQTADFPTVYAAHFLIEARERGQKVPPEMVSSLNSWLTRLASTPASTYADGVWRAYAIYLLARQGIKPAAGIANVEQELSHRYPQIWPTNLPAAFLAATYRLMQRNSDADRIIKNVDWFVEEPPGADDVYYCGAVHDAVLLYLLAHHFPERVSKVPQGALENIGKSISGNQVSSLTAAYTLLALDAYAKTAAPNEKLGIVLRGQRQTATSKVNVPVGAPNVQFTREGSAPAYYAVDESGFDRNPPATEVSQGIEVIHEFLGANKNVTAQVKVGEEFWVRLRVRATNREWLSQVAVVDLLPGGVEPTLDRQPGPGSNWNPQYVDRREDRVVIYGDVSKETATYVYKVRATNAGVFQAPPAFAEGMYNRQLTGWSQASKLEIVKP